MSLSLGFRSGWSVGLGVDGYESVLVDAVLAHWTGEVGAVRVDPLVDARPAVEVAARGHHWLVANAVADVAFERVQLVRRVLPLVSLLVLSCVHASYLSLQLITYSEQLNFYFQGQSASVDFL